MPKASSALHQTAKHSKRDSSEDLEISQLLNAYRSGAFLQRRISRKLGSTIAIFLILLTGLIALASWGLKEIRASVGQMQASHHLGEQVNQVRVLVGEARLREREFLLNPSQEKIEQIQTIVQDVLSLLDTLEQSSVNAHLAEQLPQVKQAISDYLDAFKSVELRYKSKGLTATTGFQGRFRQSAQEVEALFRQHQNMVLLQELLEVRTLERDYLLSKEIKLAVEARNRSYQLKKTVEASELTSEAKTQLASLLDTYLSNFDRVVSADGKIQEAVEQFNQKIEAMMPTLEQMVKLNTAELESIIPQAEAIQRRVATILSSVGAAAFLIFSLLGYWLTRAITSPLHTMMLVFRQVTTGNLLQKAQITTHDEVGVLGKMLNDYLQQLAQTMKNIAEATHTIDRETHGLTDSVKDVSQRIHELAELSVAQSAAVEETSAAMREIQAGVEMTTQYALEADQLAKTAESESQEGTRAVQQMQLSMQRIQETAQQINNFISAINEIANQTNLLSLNAAIEAAKAGEQGKGFAVVADEVRRLAENSAKVTQEIQRLIKESNQRIGQGQQAMQTVGIRLERISQKIVASTEISTRISIATAEQNSALQEVNVSLEKLAETSSQTAAISEAIDHSTSEQQEGAVVTAGRVTTLLAQIKQFRY